MYKESTSSASNPKIPFQSRNFQRESIDRALTALLRELVFNLPLSDVPALILVYLLSSELNGFWKTLDFSSEDRGIVVGLLNLQKLSVFGELFSCFCVEDFEEYRNLYGSVYRHCICLRFLAQQLMHMYTLILQREEHTLPPSSTSLASVAPTSDNFFSGTFRSPPWPLPYDDPRCSQLHAGGSSTRHDKPVTQVYEESEPLRRVKNDCRTESTSISDKWSGYNSGVSKKGYSESSLKHSLIEITGGVAYIFPSSEEEDVCPTCLEEYTPENPRIILQCTHHFHLGCIYEWMERSELCPVCGKVMVFNETS